jgi:hypothetical protein
VKPDWADRIYPLPRSAKGEPTTPPVEAAAADAKIGGGEA